MNLHIDNFEQALALLKGYSEYQLDIMQEVNNDNPIMLLLREKEYNIAKDRAIWAIDKAQELIDMGRRLYV